MAAQPTGAELYAFKQAHKATRKQLNIVNKGPVPKELWKEYKDEMAIRGYNVWREEAKVGWEPIVDDPLSEEFEEPPKTVPTGAAAQVMPESKETKEERKKKLQKLAKKKSKEPKEERKKKLQKSKETEEPKEEPKAKKQRAAVSSAELKGLGDIQILAPRVRKSVQ